MILKLDKTWLCWHCCFSNCCCSKLGRNMTSKFSDVASTLVAKELRDCSVCHETPWSNRITPKSPSARHFCPSLGIKTLNNIGILWQLVSVKRLVVTLLLLLSEGWKRQQKLSFCQDILLYKTSVTLAGKLGHLKRLYLHLLPHIMLLFKKGWLSVTLNEHWILTGSVRAN